MRIRLAIHEILADKAFTAIDGLISQSFVVAFIHPAVIRRVCGQTLGLGLGQIRYSSSIIISL